MNLEFSVCHIKGDPVHTVEDGVYMSRHKQNEDHIIWGTCPLELVPGQPYIVQAEVKVTETAGGALSVREFIEGDCAKRVMNARLEFRDTGDHYVTLSLDFTAGDNPLHIQFRNWLGEGDVAFRNVQLIDPNAPEPPVEEDGMLPLPEPDTMQKHFVSGYKWGKCFFLVDHEEQVMPPDFGAYIVKGDYDPLRQKLSLDIGHYLDEQGEDDPHPGIPVTGGG